PQLVVAEQEVAQPRGHGPLVLQREEEGGGQVLVDLALQLELELGDRARGARAEEEVDEVAHLLGERAEGGEVAAVELDAGIGRGQALTDLLLEHDAERYLVAFLGDQGPAAAAREARRVLLREQEVRHRRVGGERIERPAPPLPPHEQPAHRRALRLPRPWSVPASRGPG